MLSLPHLPLRCTRGRRPLVDYSKSHVVIFAKYLNILRKKIIDKVVAKEIRKGKRKQKKHKQAKRVVELGTIVDKIVIIIAKKHVRAQFIAAWTPIAIKEVDDRFYRTF